MSAMAVINCEQGSPEWYAARLGIPTASEYKKLLGIKKDARDKVTRQEYMRKLAGEIISGEPMTNYVSAAMERGKVMEDEARELYAFLRDDADLEQVGFIRNGDTGCSPDRLIGANGILEIKTNEPHILIDYILRDRFPPEYLAQCQGALMVCEREWLDLACYWPKMPLFVKRIGRDETYIGELRQAVADFNAQLAEIVAKVRGYGQPKPPKVHEYWSEMSLVKQAGIRCNDADFHRFLYARHFPIWFSQSEMPPNDRAAATVRHICGVMSRKELAINDAAAVKWIELNRAYEHWLRDVTASEAR